MNRHRMKKFTINAQYTIIRDCPTNEAHGELTEDKLHEGQGGLLGLSPFRSDGSQGSLAKRLDRMSNGQRQLKGAHQA
jgi:hypothetical protein